MTPRRQFHVFLAGVALALAAASSSTSIAHAETPPSSAAKAVGGAAGKRWLLGEKSKGATATAPAGPSNTRMALLSALVAILAGTAYVVKRRRKVVVRGASSDLTVITAAKVGAKADVVVVSVAGRRLLLGVTESQVSRLCWLEGDPDSEDASDFELPSSLSASLSTAHTSSPARVTPAERTLAAPARAPAARGFRDALLGALGRPPTPQDAALTIAASTEDVVTRSSSARVATPAGAPEMVDVEGQARGLVLRLQKRG